MNKIIKINDFIERLNNLDFKKGTKIRFQDKFYLYEYPNITGIYEIGKPTKKEYSIFAQLDITNLHCNLEIIEDKEEIDIQSIEEITCNDNREIAVKFKSKINQLIKASKQMDKKIKEMKKNG